MPKLLWVLLPLLAAALLLALQLLRGRRPSRQAINIGASLLLLLYVAATAGLGLFWVAQQQLPVFDWHYLFGYGTVLLLVLHLVFNLPLVWRFYKRRRTTTTAAQAVITRAAAAPARRGLLGLLALVAASGAAFVLGLRQGRDERKPAASAGPGGAATPPDAAAAALAFIEHFHALSSHTRAGLLAGAPGVVWGDPPPPFKRPGSGTRLRLPPPGTARPGLPDLSTWAAILWHTAGVTAQRGGLHLRASPSSGALFSTELYLAVRALPGLAPGIWHYDAQQHALEQLQAAPSGPLLPGVLADDRLNDAPALLLASAVFGRTGHKYRERCYRYVLADLGHALENLRVVAAALGLVSRFATAFDEARAAQLLGLDEADEGVLALVALGPTALFSAPVSAAPGPAEPTTAGWRPRWPAPAAQRSAAGVTAAVHAATSLHAESALPSAALALPAQPILPPPTAMPQAQIPLPSTPPSADDTLRLIATRRSHRRFAATPLALQTLASVLARMTAAPGPLLSAAVRISVVAHQVDGLARGAYRYQPALHRLLPMVRSTVALSRQRAAARAAALDQDVIADAALVFVLSIDRRAFAADRHGPARGYRHALLEAGMVGERVYLEAAAQGLGACAVGAFYDDEAAALVGLDPAAEWAVHFAALGVKA